MTYDDGFFYKGLFSLSDYTGFYQHSNLVANYHGPQRSCAPHHYDLVDSVALKIFMPTSFDRKPKLYFTIGPPRSGKSTKAKLWLQRRESLVGEADDGYPRYLWDSDILRLELYDKRYYREGEALVFAVKNLAIRSALKAGHDVVVAGTHTSRASIRRLLEIDREAIPVLVDTPEHICLFRAITSGQNDLVERKIPQSCKQVKDLIDYGIEKTMAEILSDIDNKVPY